MTPSLKTKIMGGYLVLVLIITAVGAWAVFNFTRLNNTITNISRENYRSIQAAENMVGALERQDSAELLLLLGETQRAFEIFNDGQAEFLNWFNVAESNITVPGEDLVVQRIREKYQAYTNLFPQLVNMQQEGNNQEARRLYLDEIEPQFKFVRVGLKNLEQLNNETLIRRNINANNEARSAIWSTLIVASLAIIIGFFLGSRISEAIVRPTINLTERVRMVGEGNWQGDIPVESTDEIGHLATEFNQMTARLRSYEETTLGKLMAERRKSEIIVRVISDGVIVLDEQYRMLLVNPSAETIFGIAEQAVIGKQFLDAISRRDIFARLEEATKKAQGLIHAGNPSASPEREKASESRQTFVVKVGLQDRYYQLEIIPLEGPPAKVAGLLVVFKDITFFKELDRLKTEFISKISHELRTPLTTMAMGIGLLKESTHLPTGSKEAEIMEAVDEETARLTRLVNQLLDLSRLETGGAVMSLRPVDVNELLHSAVELFKVATEQQNVHLQVSVEPTLLPVIIDYDKIFSVLTNLLDNALRYTTAGDVISLEAKSRNGSALISVADTGTGIPPQDQNRIFDKFYQIKCRPGGGAGLGLAICKEIVELHGGSIWVVSEEGKGSTFYFTLPFDQAERGKPQPAKDSYIVQNT